MKNYILTPFEGISKIEKMLEEINSKLSSISSEESRQAWINNKEACEFLGVTSRTLQSYRDKGIISFSQVGSKIYYKVSDLEKHLEDHYVSSFVESKRGRA